MKVRAITASIIGTVLLAACAGSPTMTQLPPERGHEVTVALAKGVSDLQIDPGSFEISDEAKKELLGAFRTEMTKICIPVTPAGAPVTLRVSEFKTRPVAARILLGVLSGSDHIAGTVSVAGTGFDVADTGISVVGGLGVVARNVGTQTADGIGQLAGVTVK
ncbi:hypothetical protein ACFQ3P_34935 [Paraburkholderia sabiae]|uniref:DUF4410 domain-containing protein n=1 Tax=Paraburkholderia sabiae TaxID=273251 RepID=A0ABU9QLL3_9BURK|nr:hypothetical protein [Paraburkholderia sabiae]WJZ73454.1 hypothetical protein QEN71_25470 [Paraburkholderia sabiae]CAD6560942.1 hypothetical protein LMG24235_07117 [Paraburkholderia sabiae]